MAGLFDFAKFSILGDVSSILEIQNNAIFFTNRGVPDAPVTGEQYAVGLCVAQSSKRRFYLYASVNYTKGAWARIVFQNDDSGWMKLSD